MITLALQSRKTNVRLHISEIPQCIPVSYIQATNEVGLYSVGVSAVFLCDSTPPEGGYIKDGQSPDKVSSSHNQLL